MFKRKRTLLGVIALYVILCLFLFSDAAQAADNVTKVGEILTAALPVASAGMVLGLKDKQGAFQYGESWALSLGLTYGLKFTVNETRPNGESQSFPSVHSSIAFTSAEYMRKRYGWKYGVPAYVAASLVAYSRVHGDEHYTHDVIAGAVIGIASSYLFTQPYKGWNIQPDFGHACSGIRMIRSW